MVQVFYGLEYILFGFIWKTQDCMDNNIDSTLSKLGYCIFKYRKLITSADISGAFFMNSLKTKFNPDWFDPV